MSLADIATLAAKSAVVAGMGLVLARVVARRAGDRVVMLRSAVVLTLALPLMTALLPVLEWAVLPAERVAATAAEPIWAGRIETGAGYAVSGVIERPGPEIWIALAWLAVSAALGLRQMPSSAAEAARPWPMPPPKAAIAIENATARA